MFHLSTWQKWLKQNQQAQQAVSPATTAAGEARHKMEVARGHLTFLIEQNWPDVRGFQGPATSEQVKEVMGHLTNKLGRNKHKHDPGRIELQKALNDIQKACSRYDEDKAAYDELSEQQTQAEKTLASSVQAMPAPTPKAVAAIEIEIADRRQKVDKIDATLAAMKDSSSIAAELETTANAAAEEVERLEAQALLGSVDEAAKGKAVTALTKARKESEKAAEQTEKQKAAKRGLEKMRHDWEAELESLQTLLNGVGFEVAIAEAAKHEQTLLAALESIGLDRLLANINRVRDQATAYADGKASYSTARMQVKLPILYEVSAPDDIEY